MKLFKLTSANGETYLSRTPGTLGGHCRTKIYGRLDCRTALNAIAKGGYVNSRVFFADENAAIAAGYRPCAHCMPEKYQAWKALGTSNPGPKKRVSEVAVLKVPGAAKFKPGNASCWPIPSRAVTGMRFNYWAWFYDGYVATRTPYKTLYNAIFGTSGGLNLIEGKVAHFAKHGRCTLFAVSTNDDSTLLVIRDTTRIYRIDQITVKGNVAESQSTIRDLCSNPSTDWIWVDEFRTLAE